MEESHFIAQGLSTGPEAAPAGEIVYAPFPSTRSRTISGALDRELSFFTTAILHLRAGMDDGPFTDFGELLGRPPTIYHHRFDRPIFKGLSSGGDGEWNHVLLGISKELWPSFVDFLLSIVLVDRPKRRYIGVGYHEVDVVDPALADRRLLSETPQMLRVGVFGVNGNQERAYLKQSGDRRVNRPRLEVLDPDEEVVESADKLFSGKNPHS